MSSTTSPVGDAEAVRTGKTLRTLREARGVPAHELADQVGITPRMLAYIERGDRRLTPINAHKIAAALMVPVVVLLSADDARAEQIAQRVAAVAS